jgi:hypothetical protein
MCATAKARLYYNGSDCRRSDTKYTKCATTRRTEVEDIP